MSVLAVWVPETCPEHGSEARTLPNGEPACPGCRLQKAADQVALEVAAAQAAHLVRLGWRGGRPPRDAAMRQANDHTLPD